MLLLFKKIIDLIWKIKLLIIILFGLTATSNVLGLAIKPKNIGSCWKSDPKVLGLAQNSCVYLLNPTVKFKFLKNIYFL